jgi:hypothetical protein
MPRVFVSYSHDSPEHSQRVLELAWTLRDNGITVQLDQFHQHEIVQWPRWCRQQMKRANSDFVVCICTAEYRSRLDGNVPPEQGKGVYWEGDLLENEIYDAKGNTRIIPVLLGDEPETSLPEILAGWTRCRLHDFSLSDAGFEVLIRILTNQPKVALNPVATVPDLSTMTAPESISQTAGASAAPWQSSPIAVSKLPRTGDVLIGRALELRRLTQAWKNPTTSIVQIVAPGGVGKTQLVKKWRERLLDKDRSRRRQTLDRAAHEPNAGEFGYPVRVFDWSFYSQGTQQQASADDFFDRALRWFGEAQPENVKDPWAKGERLAELVRQQRTLLILDGMEPLQHPPGPMAGELTDPSIKALLQGLQRDNPGLCIVTTREAVPTLDEMSEPKRVTVDLDSLSPQAGAELLTHYGVTGEPNELRQASVDVDGHALALILLGTYLKARCEGDVRRRSEALLFHGHERYAAHAHKVMAQYEAWFSQQDDTGRAAVAILRLMGLFNRPADAGCLAALRAEPPIPGLTEALFVGDRDEVWQRAVERLREARLLADDDKVTGRQGDKVTEKITPSPPHLVSPSLDAHPLVREHFAVQLTDQPDAAREAHRRLYEHLKQSAPELPDNLNDMMPLYHAVAHGCKAGLWEEPLHGLYIRRVLRGTENYSIRKLGAFGADLSALSVFFSNPWTDVPKGVSEFDRSILGNQSAFYLRALGRLEEARAPFADSLEACCSDERWDAAAIRALNLSELSLTLGDVSSSVLQGEQSVELADRSGDAFKRKTTRARLGAALHANGRMKDEGGRMKQEEDSSFASAAFREAEAMQQEWQPQYPLLYSVSGYQYCDLLLESPDRHRPDQAQRRSGESADSVDAGTSLRSVRPATEPADESPEQAIARIREVRNRAETTLKIAETALVGILNQALDHLTLGRTYLAEAELQTEPIRNRGLDQGVDGESAETAKPEASACGSLQQAEQHLNQSVSLLRQSGQQDHLPRGLLHRAALWRTLLALAPSPFQGEGWGEGSADTPSPDLSPTGERDLTSHPSPDLSPQGERDFYALADRDLSEAESIAERGAMLIWQIEAALERSRLCLELHQVDRDGEAPAEPGSESDDDASGSQGTSSTKDGSTRRMTFLNQTRWSRLNHLSGSAGASPSQGWAGTGSAETRRSPRTDPADRKAVRVARPRLE